MEAYTNTITPIKISCLSIQFNFILKSIDSSGK